MKKYRHLIKVYVFTVLLIVSTIIAPLTYAQANDNTENLAISEAYIPSEESVDNEPELESISRSISDTIDYKQLQVLIQECKDIKANAHDMAEAARALGYAEDHPIILLAKEEHANACAALKIYEERYNRIKDYWDRKYAEYPVATEIWLYMKSLGWNDYICAGIIGNMMAEVGGQTLRLQYSIFGGSSYYGLCQWNKNYKNKIWGASLERQCEFLAQTIQGELDAFGYAYKKGFNFEKFLNLTDEKAVAKAFAACYERCGSATYNQRQKNATTAYNYFTN